MHCYIGSNGYWKGIKMHWSGVWQAVFHWQPKLAQRNISQGVGELELWSLSFWSTDNCPDSLVCTVYGSNANREVHQKEQWLSSPCGVCSNGSCHFAEGTLHPDECHCIFNRPYSVARECIHKGMSACMLYVKQTVCGAYSWVIWHLCHYSALKDWASWSLQCRIRLCRWSCLTWGKILMPESYYGHHRGPMVCTFVQVIINVYTAQDVLMV